MTGWLALTDEQRKTSIEQAAILSGITPKAIEKDWWVTFVLKILFSTHFSSYFLFKGGTSLSKGWKLIHRFSEDIDIALSPEAFGQQSKTHPSHSHIKKLKKEGCIFTSSVIKEALEAKFKESGVPLQISAPVNLTIPDKDPQALFIRYQSLYPAHPYLVDEVKIEFGVRSMNSPGKEVYIQSILNEIYPNPAYYGRPFCVTAADPGKTFLEKLFLLHEKFCSPGVTAQYSHRHSRHLYDIFKMLNTPVEENILGHQEFYEEMLEHRKYYVRVKNVDYDQMSKFRLSFVPPDNLLMDYHKDYEIMKAEMIYSDSPNFEEMIFELRKFQNKMLSYYTIF